jgi:hypothetical protein
LALAIAASKSLATRSLLVSQPRLRSTTQLRRRTPWKSSRRRGVRVLRPALRLSAGRCSNAISRSTRAPAAVQCMECLRDGSSLGVRSSRKQRYSAGFLREPLASRCDHVTCQASRSNLPGTRLLSLGRRALSLFNFSAEVTPPAERGNGSLPGGTPVRSRAIGPPTTGSPPRSSGPQISRALPVTARRENMQCFAGRSIPLLDRYPNSGLAVTDTRLSLME